MKDKNIHVVERHIEKMILGASCVFLLVVVYLYVLGQPYTVVVGNQTGVPPRQVNEKVVEAADELESLIGERSSSPLAEIPVPPYTQLFRGRIALAPMLVDELDPLGNPGLAEVGQVEFADPRPVDVALPTPPAPTGIKVVRGFGVLPERGRLLSMLAAKSSGSGGGNPAAVAARTADALANLVPEQVPRDFRYVSVAALLDLGAWRNRLKEPVEGETVPEAWWRGALMVTGVGLERQTRDPQTGQWGAAEMVDLLPGSLRLPQVRDNWVSSEAALMLQSIREQQQRIARPEFLPMAGRLKWIEPVLAESTTEPQAGDRGDSKATGDPQSAEPVAGVVALWGHDITVRPGGEYRYRIKAWVYNPLFQQERVSDERKEEYLNVLGLGSEPSQWSDPVSIAPELEFFVVGGSRKRHTATFEIWRVFNGSPRVGEFVVSPGDPVGGTVAFEVDGKPYDVPMRTGVVMVDLVDPGTYLSVEGEATAALYMNVDTEKLHTRDIRQDVESPTRQRLREAAGLSREDGKQVRATDLPQ